MTSSRGKLIFHNCSIATQTPRTREGLMRARAEGKLLGRPKGKFGKSKLDNKEKEIQGYLEKGVNKASIARIYGVSWPTLENFIKTEVSLRREQ